MTPPDLQEQIAGLQAALQHSQGLTTNAYAGLLESYANNHVLTQRLEAAQKKIAELTERIDELEAPKDPEKP